MLFKKNAPDLECGVRTLDMGHLMAFSLMSAGRRLLRISKKSESEKSQHISVRPFAQFVGLLRECGQKRGMGML